MPEVDISQRRDLSRLGAGLAEVEMPETSIEARGSAKDGVGGAEDCCQLRGKLDLEPSVHDLAYGEKVAGELRRVESIPEDNSLANGKSHPSIASLRRLEGAIGTSHADRHWTDLAETPEDTCI